MTPFGASAEVHRDVLEQRLGSRLAGNPRGVFPGCGTGEYCALSALSALSAAEADRVVASTGRTVDGRMPMVEEPAPRSRTRLTVPAPPRVPAQTRFPCFRPGVGGDNFRLPPLDRFSAHDRHDRGARHASRHGASSR